MLDAGNTVVKKIMLLSWPFYHIYIDITLVFPHNYLSEKRESYCFGISHKAGILLAAQESAAQGRYIGLKQTFFVLPLDVYYRDHLSEKKRNYFIEKLS